MARSNADKQRLYRERMAAAAAAAPILFETADWEEFTDTHTLPRKAGCQPHQIGGVVLKELTDNGLDSGASEVRLDGDAYHCVISDNGPGIAPAELARLFSVNRPMLSSRRKRLPSRGALGNGLRVVVGAVIAYHGTLRVTTKGRRYDSVPDRVTGRTEVTQSRPVANAPGTIVELRFPSPLFVVSEVYQDDYDFARRAMDIANHGVTYRGTSQPSWYNPKDLLTLVASARDAAPATVISEVFGIVAAGFQPTLAWAEAFITQHSGGVNPLTSVTSGSPPSTTTTSAFSAPP